MLSHTQLVTDYVKLLKNGDTREHKNQLILVSLRKRIGNRIFTTSYYSGGNRKLARDFVPAKFTKAAGQFFTISGRWVGFGIPCP